MMIIGAALYQNSVKEFRAGIDENALFAALQKRQDEEGGGVKNPPERVGLKRKILR